MTPRQKECLTYINDFWREQGYAPSYEEIRTAMGAKSKSSVSALVAKLEERGYVERIPNLARSVRVVNPL
jgi:repressor LexA